MMYIDDAEQRKNKDKWVKKPQVVLSLTGDYPVG